MGVLKLDTLDAHTIQGFINSLSELSPKTVRNIHGVFHMALQQAVKVGYLRFNPADACELPRLEQKKIRPLDDRAMGKHFSPSTVYHEYKRLVASIGLPDARLHDLRHPNVKFKTKNLYLLSIKLEISDFAVKRREIIERESG